MTARGPIEVHVERDILRKGFNVYVGRVDPETGAIGALARIPQDGEAGTFGFVWEDVEPGVTTEPTMFLTEPIAQSLAGSLVEGGVRPDEDARLEGELEATRAHLEDVRALLGLDEDLVTRKVEVER